MEYNKELLEEIEQICEKYGLDYRVEDSKVYIDLSSFQDDEDPYDAEQS